MCTLAARSSTVEFLEIVQHHRATHRLRSLSARAYARSRANASARNH
jgi:hypothetical protein